MSKFLLVLIIVGYIVYKIGSFFFRAGAINQRMKEEASKSKAKKSSPSKSGKIKDGEYIDYEEIK